jgi:hypothetical protein
MQVKTENLQRSAGTISMQKINWKEIRLNEINNSLKFIDDYDKRNGLVTDYDIANMIEAGISERSAKRIARETEDKLFQLYTEDQEIKRTICKNLREDKENMQREYIWAQKKIQQAAKIMQEAATRVKCDHRGG